MLDTSRFDLDSIRERLASSQGQEYWRCLEELADSKEFREFLKQEFPQQTVSWTDGVSRRDFLRLMGASLALAGMTDAHGRKLEDCPYVNQPEQIIGNRFFATAFPMRGHGVLVESHEGRPLKSKATSITLPAWGDGRVCASILTLYDPDCPGRQNAGRIST